MGKIINLDTVQDYNAELGVETLHPLVSVVNMAELGPVRHGLRRYGFYCIYLKELHCGTLQYGRSRYDYQEGTLVFVAPGQVYGVDDNGVTTGAKGWILAFHPDLLLGTPLAHHMGAYGFFSYSSNEALHMSEREKQIVLGCFEGISEELQHAIDKHSKAIVVANIEVLLNHCVRFYDRQFITREVMNRDVVRRLDAALERYFESDAPQRQGLPTVGWCAGQLHLSANYFGDLVKKQTGSSAQEYIRRHIVGRAKDLLLDGGRTVSEIAYALGFKYPHHLSRMFKEVAGLTPGDFRARA